MKRAMLQWAVRIAIGIPLTLPAGCGWNVELDQPGAALGQGTPASSASATVTQPPPQQSSISQGGTFADNRGAFLYSPSYLTVTATVTKADGNPSGTLCDQSFISSLMSKRSLTVVIGALLQKPSTLLPVLSVSSASRNDCTQVYSSQPILSRIILDPRADFSIQFQSAFKQSGSENVSGYLASSLQLIQSLGTPPTVAMGPLSKVLQSNFAGQVSATANTELSFNYSSTTPVLKIESVAGGRGTTQTVYNINAYEANSGGDRKEGAPNILLGQLVLSVKWDDSILAPEDSQGLHFDTFDPTTAPMTVYSGSIPPTSGYVSDMVPSATSLAIMALTKDSSAEASRTACDALKSKLTGTLNDLDVSATLYYYYRQSPLAKTGGKLSDGTDPECLLDAHIQALINMGMPVTAGYTRTQAHSS